MKRNEMSSGQQIAFVVVGIMLFIGTMALLAPPVLPTASNYGISTDTNGVLSGKSTNFFKTNLTLYDQALISSSTFQQTTNNLATNAQQKLKDSNAIAVARANQVGADATNALNSATNNTATNAQQRLQDSNAVAIARANQVGADGTNGFTARNAGQTNATHFPLVSTLAGGSNLFKTISVSGGGATVTDEGNTNINIAVTGGSGSGETNLLGNAAPTNNTTVFGLVSIKNGVTNFVKTLSVGNGFVIVDQGGSNLAMAVNFSSDTFTNPILQNPVISGSVTQTNPGIAGGYRWSDTNGTTYVGIGSAPFNNSNGFFNLPTNGNGGNVSALWVVTVVAGTNYQVRPVAMGAGLYFDSANSILIASNVPGQNVTYPTATITGPTNQITLTNCYYQMTMTTNCALTNVLGSTAGETRWATVCVSNSTANTQTLYVQGNVRAIGAGTTNAVAVPAGKQAFVSYTTFGTSSTNYTTAVQQ